MSFGIDDNLHRQRDNVGTDVLNKILSKLVKLQQGIEDFAVKHWITYSPLIDVMNTEIIVGTPDLTDEETVDHFDYFQYVRFKPNPVDSYDLTDSKVGAGTETFPPAQRKFGGRVDFDGSFNVKVLDHAYLDRTDKISFGGWLYPIAFTGTEQTILIKDQQYKVVLNASSNTLEASVYISGAWGNAVTYTYTPNAWINWWVTWDGTTLKLFIGGVSQDTEGRSGTLNTTANDLGIGGTPAGTNRVANLTRMSWVSMIYEDVSAKANWITNHVAGILNTSTAKEIITFPFTADLGAEPDAQDGLFVG